MKSFVTVAALAVLLVGVQSADAALINGTLNINGSARVTLTEIDFLPPAGNDGDFDVEPFTQLGSFVPLAGTEGDILDLMLPGDPVGMLFSKPNFITFDADPNLTFELTFISPGVEGLADCFAAPAAGQNCTPPGSPFNLANTGPNSSTVSLELLGFVTDGSGDPPSTFTGVLTSQFPTSNFQTLLATINAGGFIQNSFSGTFDVNAIPEPGTVLLFGTGLLGLAMAARRRKQR